MRKLFMILTEDLIYIRSSYVDDINWWKCRCKECLELGKPFNYPHDYIQFKEQQINGINLELLKRGVIL